MLHCGLQLCKLLIELSLLAEPCWPTASSAFLVCIPRCDAVPDVLHYSNILLGNGFCIRVVTISKGSLSLCLYVTLWGIIPVQLYSVALIIITTNGSVATQLLVVAKIRSCAMVWLVTLAMLSVWGLDR